MCLFCKIVQGEIPCYKIYENADVLAFLDIGDDFYGHTLVVPKRHFKNLFDIPADELKSVMDAVQKIVNHYKSLGFSGANVFINNEPSAQQCVFHLHVHIIPRKENDGLEVCPTNSKQNFNFEEMQQLFRLTNV